MAKIISIHSFRGGTGKSNTTANLSTLIAAQGYRVGVIDTDIQSPGIHVVFGRDPKTFTRSLNDYLWGRCAVEEAAYDVTASASSMKITIDLEFFSSPQVLTRERSPRFCERDTTLPS